jgi:hypothetical protein
MKLTHIHIIIFFFLAFLAGRSEVYAQQENIGFTKSDRDRLIRMEATLEQHGKELARMEGILEQHEKRFESIDKHFDQVDKRFEELRNDMNIRFGWLIGLFTAMTIATIGFALWDRRTMIRPFETKVREIELAIEELKSGKTATNVILAFRELAKTDSKVAEVLKTYHLL